MSDLYNKLIDELEKCDIFVRYSTIEPKTILDLSKHDKPFKVKIRELEESYQKNAREIHTLENDNLFFKQRITEIEDKRNRMYEINKILRKNCNNFYKENQELKQRIAELESREMENFSEINTSNPLACAESLIKHMTHCEKFMIMPERDVQTFSVEELKEIADYLMVYYKHHRDRDAEDTISF